MKEIAIPAILLLIAPSLAYFSTIGSADLRPAPRGVLNNRIVRFAIEHIFLLLLCNGLGLSLAFVLWKVRGDYTFLLPLAATLFPFTLQFAIATQSVLQTFAKGKKRRK